uniref:Putative monocarboxylate transporter n=1 Tax=Xenopsylla cheopis TaxID=163159 RepID=A0A6M2E475_XENCH
MMVNILVPGTVKSFGVLFVEFLEVFDASPAAAAWIPALCYFLYSSLGPVSSILSVKYSYRTVTILGGTFAAAGMIISFWASSVIYLYFSYGILVGTGAGLSFPPTVYIVTSYFVKRRGLANGLCISGSAIGSIVLPPVLRYLLQTYGYRGAVLIMGAVTLNVWVAAIFYQPVEKHMKRVLEDSDIVESTVLESPTTPDNKVAKFMITSDEMIASPAKSGNLSPETQLKFASEMDNGFIRSASAVVVQNYRKNEERERKTSVPTRDYNRTHSSVTKNQMMSTPALHSVPESARSKDYFSHSRLPSLKERGIEKIPKRSPSTSSFQYISTPYHGSTLSALHPSEFTSHVSLKSLGKSLNPISTCYKSKEKLQEDTKSKFFDVSLLCDPTYLVILISNCTNAISYTNFVILIPSYAITLGFDKELAAWLLSIVSALDLIGRIGGSALSDTELIPKQYYFIGGLAVSGISLALLPIAHDYVLVCVCCGIFGAASGVYVGVTAVIMADMLGTERLTSSYGISLFVNGILQLMGPPLCGLWYERAGTYVPLITTLGFVLIGGATIWGFIPFINRRKKIK